MLAELIKSFLPKQNRYYDPGYWIELFKAKVGGKYLKRWQVTNPRTGKKSWKYKYKPLSQRGAHEITLGKFKKVTKIADETHKAAVEKALQEGHSISMHILKDYPDLIKKYNKSAKVRNFDRISSKVKDAMINRVKPETISEPTKPEPVKEQPEPAFKLEAESLPKDQRERNMTQDLFAKKPTDKIVNQNYKPKASLKETTPQGLTTEVKDALLKEGMDSKAREFTDRAMRAKNTDEIIQIASEYVTFPKEPSKPKSSSPELDKARKEQNPKQKWISLKAILDKAQKSGKIPDGLEAEVKQAGRDYVNHVMSGDWTDKSPAKSFE
jgi:hypothetical protein